MSFESARITIGRAASSDLHFDPFEDLAVAPHHAEILLAEDGIYYLHDLGSRGGTFVNGERIHHRAPLYPEDILRFGENGPEIAFRLGRAHPGVQPLPPEPLPVGELLFVVGADAGRTFIVPADAPTRIGRRADLEVPLDPRGDLVVSGLHATIEFWNGRFIIDDMSRNGTFVNGELIQGRAVIQDGDEIMLGENGPRAQLRVMPARRVYPNLVTRRPAQAAAAPPPSAVPASVYEAPPAPEVPAGPVEPVPPVQPAEVEAPGVAEEPAAAEAAPAPSAPPAARPSRALRGYEPLNPAPPQHRARIPMRINLIRKHPAPVPRLRRRTSPARRLALAGVFVLAVLAGFGIWRWWTSRGRPAPPPPPGELIASQVRGGDQLPAGQGHFSILVPRGWVVRQSGPGLMLEPPDGWFSGALIVDYYRAPGLTPNAVRRLISLGEAPVADLSGISSAAGGVRVSGYLARSGGTVRLAVLHEPELDVPAVAVLEAPVDRFAEIPEETLADLLVEGVKLQALAPRPKPTPTPVPTPAPTPAVPPKGTGPTTASAAGLTPPGDLPSSPTEIARATPAPEPETTAPAGTVGGALDVTINVPAGWQAEEEEDAEGTKIVLLHGPDGFDVRIARDPERLDMDEIVNELVEKNGWKMVAKPNVSDRFRAVNIRRDDENVIMAFVYEPAGTTLVVYSTKQGAITGEERQQVSNIVGDLLSGPADRE